MLMWLGSREPATRSSVNAIQHCNRQLPFYQWTLRWLNMCVCMCVRTMVAVAGDFFFRLRALLLCLLLFQAVCAKSVILQYHRVVLHNSCICRHFSHCTSFQYLFLCLCFFFSIIFLCFSLVYGHCGMQQQQRTERSYILLTVYMHMRNVRCMSFLFRVYY